MKMIFNPGHPICICPTENHEAEFRANDFSCAEYATVKTPNDLTNILPFLWGRPIWLLESELNLTKWARGVAEWLLKNTTGTQISYLNPVTEMQIIIRYETGCF